MATTQNGSTHLRFLHCSDIHLDTPFFGLTPEKSEERRRELKTTFMRIMQYVRNRSIQVVMISGDLFDRRYATNATAEVLIREFRACPDTVFIIAPGKCDCYRDNPIYTSERLPANCYVFSDDKLSRFDFDRYNITVYGWAFTDEQMTESPLYGRTVDDPSRINIVCGYADLNGSLGSTDCPVSEADLKGFGADYYALGSRHSSGDFVRLSDSIYSYCGSPECCGFEDTGIGGANLIVVDYDDGKLNIDVKRLSFGRVRFVNAVMDITGIEKNNEIIRRLSQLISEKKYGAETALRVELVGEVAPDFVVSDTIRSESFGLYFFDIIDHSLPLYGAQRLVRDMSTRGEVYRKLLPLMQSDSLEERRCAARAFRVALASLEGRETDL